jgi:hypothetical protein
MVLRVIDPIKTGYGLRSSQTIAATATATAAITYHR